MSLETIEETIRQKPAVLLYFWGEHCNVCHALQPKLFELFERRFPEFETVTVDIKEHADIAARFGVFSIPTGIIFLDGREFERFGRNLSLSLLEEKIARPYGMMFS